MAPGSLLEYIILCLGFGVAGLLASGYELLMARPLQVGALTRSSRIQALATVPVLVFAAPFVIMRYVFAQAQMHRSITFVASWTILAGFWSVASGIVTLLGWISLVRHLA